MTTSTPRRAGGRTLITVDPDQLVWVLLARESTDRERQLDNQLTDLRARVARIGGRIDREIPENAVSAFKRQRVSLPDGTCGYRVVRPEWEKILTALRRGECNALMVPDIDRAMRDPRTLEDLIDVVELYGVYVASLTGNIDLTSDAGISAARSLVNQRNQESRNTSRRVIDGQRHAAMAGGNHGGRMRPFGWRRDRIRLNKREAGHIRRELPRILAGVSPLALAREWNKRGIPTVTGVAWRAATIRNMYLRPRLCGLVLYQGAVLFGADGSGVRGKWEPILTEEEYRDVVARWGPSHQTAPSRLGAKGRGYRTIYLLSPFVRCGKCSARMIGSRRQNRRGEPEEFYRCPAKGAGGCSGVTRLAEPVNTYIRALVIAEQQKVQFRKLEELPPWPKAHELAELQGRINAQQQNFEAGNISAERHFSSLARMEAVEAGLKRERRQYEGRAQARRHAVANLAEEWDKPDFTMEQKQAAIAQTLTAVVIKPSGKGGRFHPDQIVPIFRDDTDGTA
ncbi:MAG TPA: recombinase family protein [Pseudonocardiaceae bacterium]|nr:recombinase family protein [Pseudonocardiaceae bacterium]